MKNRLWDEKTQKAIDEIKTVIQSAYPEASFRAYLGEDPAGVYLNAYTSAEDDFLVLDLISDRLVDLHIDEGVRLYVIPLSIATVASS
jgi:hypothetical protein